MTKAYTLTTIGNPLPKTFLAIFGKATILHFPSFRSGLELVAGESH